MNTAAAQLEQSIYDYLDAFNTGKLDQVVDAYTDDAVNHPPIGPAEVRGKRKLRQYFRQTFELNRPEISDYQMDYQIQEDRAVIRENWTVTFRPSTRPASSHRGQAIWSAHYIDGSWKTHWLIGKLLD